MACNERLAMGRGGYRCYQALYRIGRARMASGRSFLPYRGASVSTLDNLTRLCGKD